MFVHISVLKSWLHNESNHEFQKGISCNSQWLMQWEALHIACILTSCQSAHTEFHRQPVLGDIEHAHMKPATTKLISDLTIISPMGHWSLQKKSLGVARAVLAASLGKWKLYLDLRAALEYLLQYHMGLETVDFRLLRFNLPTIFLNHKVTSQVPYYLCSSTSLHTLVSAPQVQKTHCSPLLNHWTALQTDFIIGGERKDECPHSKLHISGMNVLDILQAFTENSRIMYKVQAIALDWSS